MSFELNGADICATYAGNTNGYFWENLSIEDVVTVSDGDTFKVVTDSDISSPNSRSRIIAIKLG